MILKVKYDLKQDELNKRTLVVSVSSGKIVLDGTLKDAMGFLSHLASDHGIGVELGASGLVKIDNVDYYRVVPANSERGGK